MSKKLVSSPDISRRAFLLGASKTALGAIVATTIGTGDAVGNTLKANNREAGIPQSFIDQIDAYESSDHLETGNPEKYRALVVPLIEAGLDNPENLKKLRYLIYRELKKGYIDGASPEYREYNSEKTWNDVDFFGGIGEKTGTNYIQHVKEFEGTYIGAHGDVRIFGNIDPNTPEEILGRVEDRLEGEEGENITFIMKDRNNIDIFVYYENGKLKYFFPTTPGNTEGKIQTPTPANLKVINRLKLANYFKDDISRGDGTKGGAMPYSRRLDKRIGAGWGYKGHNTHVGNVTKNGGSHGCARLPILGAYLMFYGLKPETLVYYRPELHLP